MKDSVKEVIIMSETANNDDALKAESQKPVHDNDSIKFPPFPDPTNDDFEEDVSEEERNYYKKKFPDLNAIKSERLHCTACDRHLGCSARNEARMRQHPMLRTLVCHTCHSFYNSGEFEKGDDGSELYCRWCGQGGQVYCCSDCPHVFCAKCIKRNFGILKIREIENTDDWKCFKCNPGCLQDLRAVCWALLRFCDLRNKIAYNTEDPNRKEALQKACAVDDSECCKSKQRRKEKDAKKKESENTRRSTSTSTPSPIVTKLPPTIQVKKFASMIADDSPKEKKAQKRPLSPKIKPPLLVRTPTAMGTRIVNPIPVPPLAKKIRLPTPIRFQQKNMITYPRVRPKPPQMTQMPQMAILNNFNGFNNATVISGMVPNDNINLSLENLTQGLDMSAVAGLSGFQGNDVVCTPDFPLEPLCEVTEDNNDDDVQCITPPVAANVVNTPVLSTSVPRFNTLTDLSSENIIQMTENDVTVNASTGGLKFRVDPQTLSSNKMYRLPDGRIFAINANPNMPGGYSATIVAFTENDNSGKIVPRGSTFAAKLTSLPPPETSAPAPTRQNKSNHVPRILNTKRHQKPSKSQKNTSPRQCDLIVPIEWYRYNLVDAVDALEYSLSRLQKLKKEATTMFLRTRTVDEMRILHKSLDRLLNTSSTRFNEIKDNLNKEMKQYLVKKKIATSETTVSDDDDDVEILNDLNENDDPIFIDENSSESVNAIETTCNTTHEVDLTGPSSEHNDSAEKSTDSLDKDAFDSATQTDSNITHVVDDNRQEDSIKDDKEKLKDDGSQFIEDIPEKHQIQKKEREDEVNDDLEKENTEEAIKDDSEKENTEEAIKDDLEKENTEEAIKDDLEKENTGKAKNNEKAIKEKDDSQIITKIEDDDKQHKKKCENEINNTKNHSDNLDDEATEDNQGEDKDTEMSDELIENLLKDDSDTSNLNTMDIKEE